MKRCVLSFICLWCFLLANAQYLVTSPDTKVRVSLRPKQTRNLDTKMMHPNGIRMDVTVNGKKVIENKEVDVVVYTHGRRRSFGKASMMEASVEKSMTVAQTAGDDGRLSLLGDSFNRLLLRTDAGIVLEVMVSNTGVAYRFSVTGIDDDYKILNLCDVFPDDKPNAILGTFVGDTVLPWRMMSLDKTQETAQEPDVWESTYPSRKIVSWRDALSSVSIGFTTNWISGKEWGKVSQSHGFYADFTYKYIYCGFSVTPSHELFYLFWDEDFAPFTRVSGSIHSWDMTGRIGFNLPIQVASSVWSFAPYVTATYFNLHQRDRTHRLFRDLTYKHHYLVGLGMKVQYMMSERVSLGAGYEYQFFTGGMEPKGRNSLLLSIGFCL